MVSRKREVKEVRFFGKRSDLRRKKRKTKRQIIYEIVKEIVKIARKYRGIIILENLNFDNKKKNCVLDWPYAQFREIIIRKAKESGIQIKIVSPKYTSLKHYKCGREGKRKGQLLYCPFCNETINIHANSAINLASIYLTHSW
ncbi:MAG: IS200/IS605 family accessory protein TnpB-related protein [Candidatus Helarchaeota archaeon]